MFIIQSIFLGILTILFGIGAGVFIFAFYHDTYTIRSHFKFAAALVCLGFFSGGLTWWIKSANEPWITSLDTTHEIKEVIFPDGTKQHMFTCDGQHYNITVLFGKIVEPKDWIVKRVRWNPYYLGVSYSQYERCYSDQFILTRVDEKVSHELVEQPVEKGVWQMKIIYEYENADYGIVVVEQEPQARTIWANSPRQLYFPYIINIITYDKVPGGKVSYGGIYKTGLIVLLANKSPKTLDDTVYICPTESGRKGLVCTPHQYDNKTFDSLNELLFFVTAMWWQIHHGNFIELEDWKKKTVENILESQWDYPITIREAIQADYPAVVGYGRALLDHPDHDKHTSISIPSTDKDLIDKTLKMDLKF